MNRSKTKRSPLDMLMLIALSALAYMIFNILHTVVGHGGSCYVIGDRLLATTMTHAECANINATFWSPRIYFGSGHVVNALAAIICLLLLPLAGSRRPTLHYFLWLEICINTFNVGNALLVAPFFGDWLDFSQGLQPQALWSWGLAALGALIIITGFILATRIWQPLIAGDADERKRRMRLLTLVPCATAFIVSVIAGVLGPLKFEPGLMQALLGPTSVFWLILAPYWPWPPRSQQTGNVSAQALPLERSTGWLAATVVVLIIYVGVLGPGVGTFPPELLRSSST